MAAGLLHNERAWLDTVEVGAELEMHGPKGLDAFDAGYGDLERLGYISVERDGSGLKIVRRK